MREALPVILISVLCYDLLVQSLVAISELALGFCPVFISTPCLLGRPGRLPSPPHLPFNTISASPTVLYLGSVILVGYTSMGTVCPLGRSSMVALRGFT
jgi:hypothetical protein